MVSGWNATFMLRLSPDHTGWQEPLCVASRGALCPPCRPALCTRQVSAASEGPNEELPGRGDKRLRAQQSRGLAKMGAACRGTAVGTGGGVAPAVPAALGPATARAPSLARCSRLYQEGGGARKPLEENARKSPGSLKDLHSYRGGPVPWPSSRLRNGARLRA